MSVLPSTIYRRIQRFVPEFEKRCNQHGQPTEWAWRLDEMCVLIEGIWRYQYRAVDKQGRTVDFQLRKVRGFEAAKAFVRKALHSNESGPPRKVTLDGDAPSYRALLLLRRENRGWRKIQVRLSRFLKNIVEQDRINALCSEQAGLSGPRSA